MSLLTDIYLYMENHRKKFGTYKKCEFHMHSPASHDYKIRGVDYKDICVETLLDISVESRVITQVYKEQVLANIDYYTSDDYLKELAEAKAPYTSFKEYLAYTLLANNLFSHGIDVAIITDHNTINGYNKLQHAIVTQYRTKFRAAGVNCVTLFLGVEISCSEGNHLVCIFEESKYDAVGRYLKEVIYSEQGGTYHTSYHVMEAVCRTLDGFAYLAHMNTCKYQGTEVYYRSLFASQHFKVFGLTELSREDAVRSRINGYVKHAGTNVCSVYEGDSDDPDTIGRKNTWVKFSDKPTFASLMQAFNNHKISIHKSLPDLTPVYIKGVMIDPGEQGFLSSEHSSKGYIDSLFKVHFSSDLNCVIGGRGTGKSTLLSVLESSLSSDIVNMDKLKFVSRHKIVYILIHCDPYDYILRFIPQTANIEDVYNTENVFLPKAFSDDKSTLSDSWVELFRVDGKKETKLERKAKLAILEKVYRRGYSVNELVQSIDSGYISDFIRKTVLFGVHDETTTEILKKIGRTRTGLHAYLRTELGYMAAMMQNRQNIITERLSSFNNENKELIRIVYSPGTNGVQEFLNTIFKYEFPKQGRVAGTVLTWREVEAFLDKVVAKLGYLVFLDHLLNERYFEIERCESIRRIASKRHPSISDIHGRLTQQVDDETLVEIYDVIKKRLTSDLTLFKDSIMQWYASYDHFTIEFNANKRESVNQLQPNFKPITELSLGQKVVAILTFVFTYGDHAGDNTPLVIDQPEDNLDNQYVYKTLVHSLRKIKNNRQVIIVTHSSTIVTNADAEQVIVMASDGVRGWIEKTGYPSERTIITHIINFLEGGVESFRHKMDTYALHVESLH